MGIEEAALVYEAENGGGGASSTLAASMQPLRERPILGSSSILPRALDHRRSSATAPDHLPIPAALRHLSGIVHPPLS
jgi:hypothetical protein